MQSKRIKNVKLLFIDLETKSSCPIENGPTRYFADKHADWLICAVIDPIASGKTSSMSQSFIQTNYTGGKKISAKVLNHKGLFVAHNWFFEWSFFAQFYPGTRAADFKNWVCTAALARWFGICAPRAKLEDVAAAFDLEKMPEGKNLIARYCVPQKDGGFNICVKGSDDAIMFEKYCLKDAELSKAIFEKLDGHGGFNYEEFRAAQAIDVRGVPVDVKAAAFLLKRKDKDKREAYAKAEAIAGKTPGGALVLSASGAFVEYMQNEFDIDLPDARAGTLDAIDFTTDVDSRKIEYVLYIRKLLTARAGDKAEAILNRVHNDRVRSATVFHAAGTGRFQSWGTNFFNFSRQKVKNWEKEKNTAPVPALQRGIIRTPKGKTLIESDWRGIENYLSLYFAGDYEQLARIEAGESPYLIFAESLYGESITKSDKRYVPAKSGVLGCGYGAGAKKFSIVYNLSLDEATRVRDGWHRMNKRIVALWYDFSDAFKMASIRREEATSHGFIFSPLGNDNDVKITLLDGHVLYYRGLVICHDAKNRLQILRDSTVLHGGLLLENLMQATCARLLYRALVACETKGLEVVLHVYDSIMIESWTKNAKKDAAELKRIMTNPPAWAPDLRLAVDIRIGKRWTKE